MPLLDHSKPPLDKLARRWAYQAPWSTYLADQLTARIPDDFVAAETWNWSGRSWVRIESHPPEPTGEDPWRSVWQPGEPDATAGIDFYDDFSVHVYNTSESRSPAAAVLLVTPDNKATAKARAAFAARCATLLSRAVALIVIDSVPIHPFDWHGDAMRLLGVETGDLPGGSGAMRAIAYRPVVRGERTELDCWAEPVHIGQPLPTLPLRLIDDYFVPVEFEPAYMKVVCGRRLL